MHVTIYCLPLLFAPFSPKPQPSISSSSKHAKMIGYFFAIIPLYVLVYVPLTNILFGGGIKRQLEEASSLQLNSSFIATNDPISCPKHSYNTYILSHEPLMVYIEGFLSLNESKHLVRVRCVCGFLLFFFIVFDDFLIVSSPVRYRTPGIHHICIFIEFEGSKINR